jgi:hypothetical protein
MAACRALDCLKPAGRRPFCRDCLKALPAGDVWALSMAYLSPGHSSVRVLDSGEIIGGVGWPYMDGSESMRVHFEEEGLPCWTTVKSVRAINEVLQWLEYELAIVAVAAALTSRRKAKADRARLAMLARVTGKRR